MLYEFKRNIMKSLLVFTLTMFVMTGVAQAVTQDDFTADGILMETVLDANGAPSEAVAVIEVDLPDEDSLVLPMTFTGEPDTSILQAYFNDNLIEIQSGVLGESQNIDYLIFDISSYRNQTGELKLVLNNTGTEVAELFIIESVNYTDADITAVYGEAGTGVNASGDDSGGSVGIQTILLLGIIGVIGVARRRKV